jgi:hypothetical protein
VYLLMCRIIPNRQVPYWTSTHGEMISSDLHGTGSPSDGMMRPQQGAETDQRVCTREKQDVPPEAAQQSLT